MVKPVATVDVTPNLPPSLERLRELAYNLRWSWDHETIALFRRLDRDLWQQTENNPVALLGLISQDVLQSAAEDEAFMAHLDRACAGFDAYMASDARTWYNRSYGSFEKPFIAYFSMEYGLTECLRNYSGGLGILAGDHLKSATDLGLPLVGMGLAYQYGYFRQYLNHDGWHPGVIGIVAASDPIRSVAVSWDRASSMIAWITGCICWWPKLTAPSMISSESS